MGAEDGGYPAPRETEGGGGCVVALAFCAAVLGLVLWMASAASGPASIYTDLTPGALEVHPPLFLATQDGLGPERGGGDDPAGR